MLSSLPSRAQFLGEPVTVQWPTVGALLSWSPTNDANARYNRSSVSLAPRISNPALNVNSHARTNEAKVMTLVSFNSYSTGSAEGSHTTSYYPFSYWGYAGSMTFWGASDNDHGLIMCPAGHVADAAHRNGVKIYGKVFFGPYVYGGNIQNVTDFLQKSGTNFPVADKMTEAARYFGFDGWFLNQETENATAATAANMRDFISYFKAKAPELQIVWYDAMTESGNVGWQGAFNTANDWFMYYNGANVADTMFIDFRWSSSSLAGSRSLALSYGLDPYDFYTGVDAGPSGYNTMVNWSAFFPEGQTNLLSLGLFGSEWVYKTASGMTNMHARDNRFWVGSNGNPGITSSSDTWPGIAHFIPASSPVTSVPFGTCFNPGQGTNFNLNGQRVMNGQWSNLGLQDVLPTWRWLVKTNGTATRLNAALDFMDSYYGGSCLLVNGTMAGTNDLWLYQASLAVSNNTQFRLVYKTGAVGASNLKVGLSFEDNPNSLQFFDVSNTVSAGWNTNVTDLGAFAGKKIAVIALRFGAAASTAYNTRIGQLAVYHGAMSAPAAPTDIALDQMYNLDWKTYNLRLTWSNSTDTIFYYNVYRRNPDNSLSWLWATPNNCVFIPQLARTNNEAFTPVEIEAVGPDYGVSAHAVYNFQWIDPVTIPLTNSDVSGASSFDSGLNWSNAIAPAATNIYLVSGLDLRTPQMSDDQMFQGGALVLTNGGALRIKATGSGNTTTVGAAPGTALFMGGGVVSDWSGLPETLAGYVSLTGSGNIFDPQTSVFIVASQISGGGTLTVDSPNSLVGGTVILSGVNTYTNGTILNAANTLQLSGSGTLGTNSFLAISNTAGHGFGVINLNGTSQTVGTLLGTGGVITNSSSTASSLTVGSGNGSGTFQGKIISSSTRSIALNKTGSGAQTLAGNSSVASLNIALNNGSSPMTNGPVVVSAGAALSIGSGAGDSIAIASGNMGAASFGMLDVSASSNFTVNVGTIQVAVNSQNPGGNYPWTGTLNLGTNNNLTASMSIIVGDSASAFNAATSQAVLTTAAGGTTTIQTPSLFLGARKCNPTFNYGNGAVFSVGSTGSRTALSIGNSAAFGQLGTGTSFMSSNSFAAGIFNGVLSSLTIGTINNTGGGGQVGALILGNSVANHLDISGAGNVVVLGRNLLGGGGGMATGVLTVTNLDTTSVITSTDNSAAILLGATSQSAGTLNLNGGTLKITTTGSGIAGGIGMSTLNLNGVKFIAGANSTSFITNIITAMVNPGGVIFDTANFNLTVAQALANGGGSLSKLGGGRLTLSKVNTYAGNTVVGAGTLALLEPGNIASSAQIIISNAAVLDVTGRTDRTLTLNSGKTLRGSGTLLGKLNAVGGSTINPGDAIGTLVVQSNATLAGTVLMELNRTNVQPNDKLFSTNGAIAGGGTLMVNNLGPALEAGDVFVLFNQAVSGFTTVNLPALSAGNAWQNNLAVDGSLRVVSTNAAGLTFETAANQLMLTWPADHIGWRLQVQTNDLASGLGTNWFDVLNAAATNQMILPIVPDNASVFFRLIFP
ncbi:MAG: Mannosyl-glycoprotein endo-beta-N-acetylglucosaminidase [Pedosphaera sp.]|nr:Mannosyl-glycoprotein endo-beta-N-acetylglucosaminidase [Pedosphaera sp.]